MISSIHAAARYLAETNKDRFSSFLMRWSDLVGLTVNTSLTFSIAGDSTSVARCMEKSLLIRIFDMIRIFIRKSAKGTDIQREYGILKKNNC